jgi:hypothetical protein
MKGVDTIARVRREFFARGRTIKGISRDLHIARNTVRKILCSGETAFSYERDVQPLPKIGLWKDQLDALLRVNAGKSARERLTLIRVYEELRARCYIGSYDAVRRYAKGCAKERGAITAEAFVPLTFAPGEAYPFDWSHEVVLIAGVTSTVKVAHVRLCHSRMMSFVPIRARRRRWCSTLTTGRSPCSRAPARVASIQHEDGGRDGVRREGSHLQSSLPADVRPLSCGACRPHAGGSSNTPVNSGDVAHARPVPSTASGAGPSRQRASIR